jgi:hypothetical protein
LSQINAATDLVEPTLKRQFNNIAEMDEEHMKVRHAGDGDHDST